MSLGGTADDLQSTDRKNGAPDAPIPPTSGRVNPDSATVQEVVTKLRERSSYAPDVLDRLDLILQAQIQRAGNEGDCHICKLRLNVPMMSKAAHMLQHVRDGVSTAMRVVEAVPLPLPPMPDAVVSEDKEALPPPTIFVPFAPVEQAPYLGYAFETIGMRKVDTPTATMHYEKQVLLADLSKIVGAADYYGLCQTFLPQDQWRSTTGGDYAISHEWELHAQQMEVKTRPPCAVQSKCVVMNPDLSFLLTSLSNYREVYAICRNFDSDDSCAGKHLQGTLDWRLEFTNRVEIVVNGHRSPHPLWLFHNMSIDGIAWTLTHQSNTFNVYRIVRSTVSVPMATKTYHSSLDDENHFGEVDMRGAIAGSFSGAKDAKIAFEMVNEAKAISVGKFVCVTPASQAAYMLPKSFVPELAALCAGDVRDAAKLQSLVRQATTRINKYNLPTDTAVPVATVGAYSALTKFVALETRLAAAIPHEQLAIHQHLIKFKPILDCGRLFLALLIGLCVLASCAAWWFSRPVVTYSQMLRCHIHAARCLVFECSYMEMAWHYLGYCELPTLAIKLPYPVQASVIACLLLLGSKFTFVIPRIYVVIVAPVFEEYLKRLSLWFVITIPILETIAYLDLNRFLFSLCAHALLRALPKTMAIVLHISWNYVATETLSLPFWLPLVVAMLLLLRSVWRHFVDTNTDPWTGGFSWKVVAPIATQTANTPLGKLHLYSKVFLKRLAMKTDRPDVTVLAGHSTGPVYALSQNDHNLITGVTLRAAMETAENPYAVAHFWQESHLNFEKLYFGFEDFFSTFKEEEWEKFLLRYPEHLRRILDGARISSRQFGKKFYEKTAMIKMEKTVGKLAVPKLEPSGATGEVDECIEKDEIAPRIITMTSDELKANLGPPILAVHDIMKRSKVGYTPGKTAEELGAWFDEASDATCSDFVEIDVSRWDARFGPILSHYEISVYERLGSRTWITPCGLSVHDLLCATVNVLVKGQGVVYNVVATRKSGDYNTTTGNTIVNLDITWWEASLILQKAYGCINLWVIAAGDDKLQTCSSNKFYDVKFRTPPDKWLTMPEYKLEDIDPDLVTVRKWMKAKTPARAVLMYDRVKEAIPRLAANAIDSVDESKKGNTWGSCHEALGMKTKLQVHDWAERRRASFCSGRFYPTDTGSVLGPLIGRQLLKAPWMYGHSPNEAEGWLKSVMIGNTNSWSFVPCLRVSHKYYMDRLSTVNAIKLHQFERNEKKYSISTQAQSKHQATDESALMFELIYQRSMAEAENELLKVLEKAPMGSIVYHPILQHLESVDN